MSRPLFMGIDGGGSYLRIAIAGRDLKPLCAIRRGPANPGVIGRAEAAAVIRQAIAEALAQAQLQPDDIAAVAIGIAGASNLHSADWLIHTIKPALPASLLIPSSDLEIALVGAHARPSGILLLAGTGAAVFGIAPDGRRLQVGGWGYLLGDEGSGHWLGLQLLRRVIAKYDEGASSADDLPSRICLDALGLQMPRDLIAWLYRSDEPAAPRIAGLAEIVLRLASNADEALDDDRRWAKSIVDAAARTLARQVDLARSRLNWQRAPIAFAGGLLENDNPLSLSLARRLRLSQRPRAEHPPVIGAALLAQMEWSKAQTV